MADRYTITGTRQTQVFQPGSGFVRAIEVGFTTPNGFAGTVQVPEAAANDAAKVDQLVCAYIDKIDAIHNL